MSKYGIAYSDLDSSFHQDNAYGYNFTPELYSGVPLNLDDNRKRLKEKAMLNLALDTLDILDSGWNGYSATPVSSKSILRAKQFIEELYPNKKYPDKVSHDGDGAVMLIWKHAQCITILTVEKFKVHISYESQGEPLKFYPDIIFDGNLASLPTQALNCIPNSQ